MCAIPPDLHDAIMPPIIGKQDAHLVGDACGGGLTLEVGDQPTGPLQRETDVLRLREDVVEPEALREREDVVDAHVWASFLPALLAVDPPVRSVCISLMHAHCTAYC